MRRTLDCGRRAGFSGVGFNDPTFPFGVQSAGQCLTNRSTLNSVCSAEISQFSSFQQAPPPILPQSAVLHLLQISGPTGATGSTGATGATGTTGLSTFDIEFLSILHFQLQAGIFLSEQALETSCLPIIIREAEMVIASQRMFLGQIAAILAANGAQLNFSALAYVQSDTGLIRLERPRCIMGRNYLILLTQLQMEVLEAATLASQRSTNASVIALANAVIARVQQEVAQYTVLINGSSCQ